MELYCCTELTLPSVNATFSQYIYDINEQCATLTSIVSCVRGAHISLEVQNLPKVSQNKSTAKLFLSGHAVGTTGLKQLKTLCIFTSLL